MRRDAEDREVVYVERESGSLKPLLLGMAIGAGLALLFAPESGEQTRRKLRRQFRKWRALTEETVGELSERITDRFGPDDEDADEPVRSAKGRKVESAARPSGSDARPSSAREELERRLAEARARRRGGGAAVPAPDDEEPLA